MQLNPFLQRNFATCCSRVGGQEESHLSALDGLLFMASNVCGCFSVHCSCFPTSADKFDTRRLTLHQQESDLPFFSYGDRKLSIMVLPSVFTIEYGEVSKI